MILDYIFMGTNILVESFLYMVVKRIEFTCMVFKIVEFIEIKRFIEIMRI